MVGSLLQLLPGMLGARWPVQFAAASDLPPAMADPALLESALLNLAINARDAQPAGGAIVIRATIRQVTATEARQRRGAVAAG